MKKLMILLMAATQLALAGKEGGNGGDICEKSFSRSKREIFGWIKNEGHLGLRLSPGTSRAEYSKAMKNNIANATVVCVDKTLAVDGIQKTCVNHKSMSWRLYRGLKGVLSEKSRANIRRSGKPFVLCNYKRFNDLSFEEQIVLAHHEYAGLSGIETDGSFDLSDQLAAFIEDQEVKKLVVRNSGRPFGVGELEIRTSQKYNSSPLQLNYILINRCLDDACKEYEYVEKGLDRKNTAMNESILLRPGKYFLSSKYFNASYFYFTIKNKTKKVLNLPEVYLRKDPLGKVWYQVSASLSRETAEDRFEWVRNNQIETNKFYGGKKERIVYRLEEEVDVFRRAPQDAISLMEMFRLTNDMDFEFAVDGHGNYGDPHLPGQFPKYKEIYNVANHTGYFYNQLCSSLLKKNPGMESRLYEFCEKTVKNRLFTAKDLHKLIEFKRLGDYSFGRVDYFKEADSMTFPFCSNSSNIYDVEEYRPPSEINEEVKKFMAKNPDYILASVKFFTNQDYILGDDIISHRTECKFVKYAGTAEKEPLTTNKSVLYSGHINNDMAALLLPGTYNLKLVNESGGSYQEEFRVDLGGQIEF